MSRPSLLQRIDSRAWIRLRVPVEPLAGPCAIIIAAALAWWVAGLAGFLTLVLVAGVVLLPLLTAGFAVLVVAWARDLGVDP